ncbi:MAG: hypothetical protein ACI9BF_000728 [Candidatus Paceibacteria bacterium]|jgi:hypothetical protein
MFDYILNYVIDNSDTADPEDPYSLPQKIKFEAADDTLAIKMAKEKLAVAKKSDKIKSGAYLEIVVRIEIE